jgi:GMP synthase (glutamine-hydrolysing)
LDAVKKVLVVDFGGQYSQLIARRVRECRVYSEVIPYDASLAEIRAKEPAGIILSGGPRGVNDADAPTVDPGVFSLGVPVLGICYGLQLMAKLRGGRGLVRRSPRSVLLLDEPW